MSGVDVRIALILAGLLLGPGCVAPCRDAAEMAPRDGRANPGLRVMADRVLSRGPGWEAELSLPVLRGLQDDRLARGVSAWLQRAPRKALAAWRDEAAREASPASPWTLSSRWEVTHDGPRFVSIVQKVHSVTGGVEEDVLLGTTFDRESLQGVFLTDLLRGDDPARARLAAAWEATGGPDVSIDALLTRDQEFYLTDASLVVLVSEAGGTREVPLANHALDWRVPRR